MKKLIISYLITFVGIACIAQNTTTPIYLVGTAKKSNDNIEGISRFESNLKTNESKLLHKIPPIHFDFVSKSKNIRESFAHYNYNTVELAKVRKVEPSDIMEIITKPESFLNTVSYTDLDKEFPKMSKETANTFFNYLRGKKIYFIDRTEIKNGTLKLIEVEVSTPRPYGTWTIIE